MTRSRTMPKQRSTTAGPEMDRHSFQTTFESVVSNIGTVIKGKDDIIRMVLIAMIAEGHVLLEDKPGTGKTMLARAIAQSIDCRESRIQCTPDLLPSDVTGSPVLDMRTQEFVFRAGPVFSNILLADEVNRATPKTQSALLEAMQERRVSVDGVTHDLPKPFILLATQNPIELAGTFPLPEAQLDRFLFKLSLGYANQEAEKEIVYANAREEAITSLGASSNIDEFLAMTEWAKGITMSDAVVGYAVAICQATREDPALMIGASTRASLALIRGARVLAATQGREDIYPDDVRALLTPVLAHRLILTPDAQLRDETVENVIERITNKVKPPTGVGTQAA